MKKNLPEFSKTIKHLMEKKKISVRALSDMTAKEGKRVPTSNISEWRNGTLATDYAGLKIIAKCLGVSLSYLLTGEDDVTPSPTESFIEGDKFFDGYAKITIQQLIPKKI